MRTRVALAAFLLSLVFTSIAAGPDTDGKESGLPLPSSIPPEDLAKYEQQLLDWLNARTYDTELHWRGDKGIRDTGPWINDVYYGTHKAAKIYYSPKVMQWLKGGRKGAIPDGAMIVKEQFDAPAARWENRTPPPVSDWTIKIGRASCRERV